MAQVCADHQSHMPPSSCSSQFLESYYPPSPILRAEARRDHDALTNALLEEKGRGKMWGITGGGNSLCPVKPGAQTRSSGVSPKVPRDRP